MRRRAEQVEETRRRITEAAMRLHTTIGPANTTISAVAEEADTTRVTLYRHFPDEEALFLACSLHWAKLHPAPDSSEWTGIDDLEERIRAALSAIYGFYREHHADLYPIMRDFETMPEAFRHGVIEAQAALSETLVTGSGIRGRRRQRLQAVARHVTSFWTWRSLVIDGGLDHDAAVAIGAGFTLSV